MLPRDSELALHLPNTRGGALDGEEAGGWGREGEGSVRSSGPSVPVKVAGSSAGCGSVSGHANAAVLGFNTDEFADNPGVLVTAAAFARAMAAVDERPLLVVLNACESEAHLEQLVALVPAAIGMSDTIGDGAATTFAARFYTSVADGQSIGSALAAAQVQMELDGHADADLPVLRCRSGLDASALQLVIPPTA